MTCLFLGASLADERGAWILKPKHDTDTTESAEMPNTPAPQPDYRFHEDYRGTTNGNRFWIQIAATIISPLVVAAVLWLSTSLSNMATKTDLKEIRTEIKEVRTEIKEVRTEIKDVNNRIDRLFLLLLPQEKK